MTKFSLSTTEVTILGIATAGWSDLGENARRRYKKIYGWSSNSLRSNSQSVYKQNIDEKDIRQLLLLKSQFDSGAKDKLRQITQIISPKLIKLSTELNFNLWRLFCEKNGRDIDQDSLKSYFADRNNNLVTLCQSKDIDLDDFLTVIVMIDSDYVRSLKKLLFKEGHYELLQALENFYNELQFNISKEMGDTKAKDHNLSASKKIIVDTLQENVMRFYEGRELIPIEMVIIKHRDSDSFYPDLSTTINKEGKYYSNAELRMVYKLMEEIPDKEIKEIMRASFFLKEMTPDKQFKTIVNPWDSHPLIGGGMFWQKRQRKEDREAYLNRPREAIPKWIKGLIKIKEQYQQKYEETNSIGKKFK